jgi:hypothetical protein
MWYDISVNCNWVDTRWQQYSTHLHKKNTQNNTNNNITTPKKSNTEECWPCPIVASFTLAFALQLRKKHGKILSQGSRRVLVYILSKHPHITKTTHTHTHIHTNARAQPHITKPTHTRTHTHTHMRACAHTLQNPHIHTHTHTLQNNIKTTAVQIKTNTVQDIPKWNSHIIIKYPQYKVTIMYIAPLSTRTSP